MWLAKTSVMDHEDKLIAAAPFNETLIHNYCLLVTVYSKHPVKSQHHRCMRPVYTP